MRTATRSILMLACLAVLLPAAAGDDSGGQRPVEIRLGFADRAELERLSTLVSIYAVRDGEALAVASPRALEELTAAGVSWRVSEKRALAAPVVCPPGWAGDAERDWRCYPTYGQYVELLETLADAHPSLCRLVDLGPTASQARPHRLWALRITDNPDIEEAEPEVLLTSTMHGDEASGFVLLLRFAHELLERHASDLEIATLVDGFEIWINPNANPDGTYFSSDDTVDGAIRFYATPAGGSSWVDPNRNFPDPDEGDHPDGNPWWPETQAWMAFAAAQSITLSANLHDGSELVNYPWDTWSRRHVDDPLLIHISRGWADLAQADGPPGYMTDQNNGITNGWDWYPVAGGRQDFMTFWHADREVTVELSDTKTPPSASLDERWTANRRALLGFIAHAGIGIHGVVTDPAGAPVEATIELVGLDAAIDNSFVRTDPDVGDYHRLALPRSYDVRISAVGYRTELIEDVAVAAESPTVLNAVLTPAQITIAGRVTTPAALRPIGGARVALAGTPHSATTAADGSYTLIGVPPQETFTVRFSAEGFGTVERALSVSEPSPVLNVALPPLAYSPVTTLHPVE